MRPKGGEGQTLGEEEFDRIFAVNVKEGVLPLPGRR